MTCQYIDRPPDTSPCYCTATHGANVPSLAAGAKRPGFRMLMYVCDHHAGVLRDQGAETWPLEA